MSTGAHPKVFGRYVLTRLVARGGMGELYLARLPGVAGVEKQVVVKTVLPHLEGKAEFLARFIDEAKIAVSLSHSNIVSVYELGEVDGVHFIAMEFVDGWDLRRVIHLCKEAGAQIPPAYAMLIAAEVCKGLTYAHTKRSEQGELLDIVHRDISPGNILISRGGDIKIADFGIAAARGRLTQTITGELKGKLAYMSPEQAAGKVVDARSDVFALGVVLFELLTGQRPFEGHSDMDVLSRVQRGERPRVDALRPELDPDICAIVERALAVDVDERYASAEELHFELLSATFRETGPVTTAQIATFVARHETESASSAPTGAAEVGVNTLLNAALDLGGIEEATGSGDPAAGSNRPGIVAVGSVSSPEDARSVRRELEREPQTATIDDARPRQPIKRARSSGTRAWMPTFVGVAVVLGIAVVLFAIRWEPNATIVVTSNPEGANVYVDGAFRGVTTLRTEVSPGERMIRVESAHYASTLVPVHVQGRATEHVEVTLQPQPALITLESQPPGAWIRVDDGPASPGGNQFLVTPGEAVHLEFTLPGFAPHSELFTPLVGMERYVVRLSPVESSTAGATDGSIDRQGESVDDRDDRGDGALADAQAPANGGGEVGQTNGGRRGDRSGDRRRADDEGDATGGDSHVTDAGDGGPTTDENGEPRQSVADVGELLLFFPDVPMVGEVTIDGRSYGRRASGDVVAVPVGRHVIRIDNASGGYTHQGHVAIGADARTRYDVVWQ